MTNATVRASARTSPKSTNHPDATLIALAERCVVAAKASAAAGETFDQAEVRYQSLETPRVIIRTEKDKTLGLYVGNRAGTPYVREDVPVLRALVRANSILESGCSESIEVWTRAKQILDALRDLKEEEAREGVESGLSEARRCYYAAQDAYEGLAEGLAKMPATTIEGVLAKARLMRHVFLNVDFGATLQEGLRRMGPDQEAFAMSLARDLFSLANGEAVDTNRRGDRSTQRGRP
jgi:hypothetical protein